jgi:predicted AlkP superfamily phosphohydrolase/phosphomutase
MLPEKHGILNFFRTGPDQQRHLYRSTDRKAHALWNIASDAGLKVGVVNWWTTFPPERIEGVMVSDHFLAAHMEGIEKIFHATSEERGPVISPRSWAGRIPRLLAEAAWPSEVPDPFAEVHELPSWVAAIPDEAGVAYLSKVYRDDARLTQLALAIESELEPDLLMLLLLGIDRVSHILWGTLEPPELYPEALRPSDAQRRAGAEALERYYEHTDSLIGALLKRYGSSDTIIVLSDHGFEADVSSDTVTGGHKGKRAIDGVLFARGPGIRAGSATGSTRVADITPTILTQLGLSLADDMDGIVAPFVETKAPPPIPSYADRPIEFVSGDPSPVEEKMIEQLRALGYGE